MQGHRGSRLFLGEARYRVLFEPNCGEQRQKRGGEVVPDDGDQRRELIGY